MNGAHLHLLSNHLPVIGTMLASLILMFGWMRKSQDVIRVGLGLFVLVAVAGVVAYLTGEPAEQLVKGYPGVTLVKGSIHQHEEAAMVGLISSGVMGVVVLGSLVFFRRRTIPQGFTALALVLSLVPAGSMAWTGFLGGQIRHLEVRTDAPVAAAQTAAPAAGGAQADLAEGGGQGGH